MERLENQIIYSFGSNKTIGSKQERQNRLMSPMSEGGEPYLGTVNFSSKYI